MKTSKKVLSTITALSLVMQMGVAITSSYAEEATQAKIGLIKTFAEGTPTNEYGTTETVTDNNTPWTRLNVVDFAWANKVPGLKFDLGDDKIKFDENRTIIVETKIKVKDGSANNGRLALKYNVPTNSEKLIYGDAEQSYAVNYNHLALLGMAMSGNDLNVFKAQGVVLNAQGGITNQTNFGGWTSTGFGACFDGEQELKIVAKLNKPDNKADFSIYCGDKSYSVSTTDLGYLSKKDYLESIQLDNTVNPLSYVDVAYLKVYDVPKGAEADYESMTEAIDYWNISDLTVSDNKTGTVSFTGVPENAEISAVYSYVKDSTNTQYPAGNITKSYSNGVTTLSFDEGFKDSARYTISVKSVITNKITFDSEYVGATGLIASADTIDDFDQSLSNCGTFSAVTDDDGTTWTRVTPDSNFLWSTSPVLPILNFNLGDDKIKFENDKIIRITARVRAYAPTDARMAMHYNTDGKVTDGTNIYNFSYTFNHSLLWELEDSIDSTKTAEFASSGNGASNNQTLLKWGSVAEGKLNGSDIFTITTDFDKSAGTIMVTETCGNGEKTFTYDNIGYQTTDDFFKNVTVDNVVSKLESFDVDYIKVYNLEKERVLNGGLYVESDPSSIDDSVIFTSPVSLTEEAVEGKFTVKNAAGDTEYSKVTLVDSNTVKLTVCAAPGEYTVNVGAILDLYGNKSFNITKTTDTTDLIDIGIPVIKNGTYNVDVVDDYVINFKNEDLAAAAVITVEGMTEGTDYIISRDGLVDTIIFTNALDYQTVYTVTIDGISYMFKTANDGKTLFHEDFTMDNALTRFHAEKIGVDDDMDFATITSDKKLMLTNVGTVTYDSIGYRLFTNDGDNWSDYELSVKTSQKTENVQEAFHLRDYYVLRRWANYAGCGYEMTVLNGFKDENGYVKWWNSGAAAVVEGSWNQYIRPYTSSHETMGNEYTLKASIVGNTLEYGIYDGDTFITHTNGNKEAVSVNENGKYYATLNGAVSKGGVGFGTNFMTNATYLDDIVVTDLKLAFTTANVKNNNGKFTIEFTEPVNQSTLSGIRVEGADSYKMLSADGKTVTIALKDASDGRYEVTVDGVLAADGTEMTEAKSFGITVKNAESSYINITETDGSATLSTNLEAELKALGAQIYVAAYDAEGRLAEVKKTVAANGAEVSVTPKAQTKVFLWTGTLTPIEFTK